LIDEAQRRKKSKEKANSSKTSTFPKLHLSELHDKNRLFPTSLQFLVIRKNNVTSSEKMIAFSVLIGFLCLLQSSLAAPSVRGTVSTGYDWNFGNTSVWLSAAAYCEANTYLTRTFKGASTGFVVTNIIDYDPEDVQVTFLIRSEFVFSFILTMFSFFSPLIGLYRLHAFSVHNLRGIPWFHFHRRLGEQCGCYLN
jgi:hypothetical protein